jgi:murein DD-endopeptidase MepM/ murein hydrolase activator NlpD
MSEAFTIEPITPNTRFKLRDDARPKYEPWRWPLQRLADREPIVLAEQVNGERLAVDLGYEPRPYDAELYVPVYAAQTGEVSFAGETTGGFAVTLDHGHRDWATHYAHMSRLFVAQNLGRRTRRRQRVRCGDVIGYAAKSPIRVRFELWNWTEDRGFLAVDPVAQIGQWITPLAGTADLNSDKKAA